MFFFKYEQHKPFDEQHFFVGVYFLVETILDGNILEGNTF